MVALNGKEEKILWPSHQSLVTSTSYFTAAI